MWTLDLSRLHSAIEDIHTIGCVRTPKKGYTVAYAYLLLGEMQLADPETCCIYVTEDHVKAMAVKAHFRRLVWEVESSESIALSETHVQIPHTSQDFFFVGLDLFLLPYSFMGTRVHKIFFDVSAREQAIYDERLGGKLAFTMTNGTEIV